MAETPYLDFLRYSLNASYPLPVCSKDIDWQGLMDWAERQTIVGIIFGGIQRAGIALCIPYEVLMKWIGYANQIENRNLLLNKRCVEIGTLFKSKGYESCILKGQGNALLYPNPLWRTPGDIDVWLCNGTEVSLNKGIKDVIRFVKQVNPQGRALYHHIDYGTFKGVEVEVHYRPTFMNNLINNCRLQRWIYEHEDNQFRNHNILPDYEKSISIPTWEFNVVFQLSHIYRHVIQRGVGLRQIIDYYYLLKTDERCQTEDVIETLRYLGLEKIAGAVMWVLKEILGLEEQYLIAPVNEHRGRFLYKEMLKNGNFGQYHAKSGKPQGKVVKNIDRLKQDFRLVRYFPSECLWEPVFRVYHWMWRLRYNR